MVGLDSYSNVLLLLLLCCCGFFRFAIDSYSGNFVTIICACNLPLTVRLYATLVQGTGWLGNWARLILLKCSGVVVVVVFVVVVVVVSSGLRSTLIVGVLLRFAVLAIFLSKVGLYTCSSRAGK